MKHAYANPESNCADMSAEYDFSHGVRGTHYEKYQNGYEVVVLKEDGTKEIRTFALPEGTVVLEPDVRTYFPTSEAVNRALRGLIDLLPSLPVEG